MENEILKFQELYHEVLKSFASRRYNNKLSLADLELINKMMREAALSGSIESLKQTLNKK